MKKVFLFLALLAIIATGAFAEGFSMAAGGGLLFDYSLNNGIELKGGGESAYMGIKNLSFGGYGFFDATYAELDVSFAYGSLTLVREENGVKAPDESASALQLGFTLLGKFPIGLGSATFFPLLGAGYNVVLSLKDEHGNSVDDPPPGDYSQIGILAGAGLDLHFTEHLFLRAEALFQLRLASKIFKDVADRYKNYPGVTADTTFGMGPRIKIGLGYRF